MALRTLPAPRLPHCAQLRTRSQAAPRFSGLVDETLAALQAEHELAVASGLRPAPGSAAEVARAAAAAKRRSLTTAVSFEASLAGASLPPLRHGASTTLQVNLGLFCNQACSHCHVESSPLRLAENMGAKGVARVLHLLRASPGVRTLDCTGGAPELNAQFRGLVLGARALGVEVIDRCNLTLLFEPGQEDLAAFLASQQVRVVASLPCYSAGNVDAQRGDGVFDRSIAALQELNAVGYGVPGSGLILDLVYNPAGPSLPPAAAGLEAAYKRELGAHFGIVFSSLICITNMPIKRFADRLAQDGQLDAYVQLLAASFNPAAAERVMCTNLVSVSWDGSLFDCDFNQQLGLGLARPGPQPTIFTLESLDELTGARVATGPHCFGCTAGAGSSCSGKLVEE